ncbi:unnamed protein product [Protopolystoma xenopodis]|uniref:Uncharacterized protein n=1 Tax=Protopolystoma xenopodis TaxID=117903 RepID=A0A448WUT8_9PLAT|nr:unnamed protein product [Protopolystoma xenopodis]
MSESYRRLGTGEEGAEMHIFSRKLGDNSSCLVRRWPRHRTGKCRFGCRGSGVTTAWQAESPPDGAQATGQGARGNHGLDKHDHWSLRPTATSLPSPLEDVAHDEVGHQGRQLPAPSSQPQIAKPGEAGRTADQSGHIHAHTRVRHKGGEACRHTDVSGQAVGPQDSRSPWLRRCCVSRRPGLFPTCRLVCHALPAYRLHFIAAMTTQSLGRRQHSLERVRVSKELVPFRPKRFAFSRRVNDFCADGLSVRLALCNLA